jgi:hypothetical protein
LQDHNAITGTSDNKVTYDNFILKLQNFTATASKLNSIIIGEMFAEKYNRQRAHEHRITYSFTETTKGSVNNLTKGEYIPIVVANSLAWTTRTIQNLRIDEPGVGLAITKGSGDAVPFEVRDDEIRFLAEGMLPFVIFLEFSFTLFSFLSFFNLTRV